MLQIRVYLQQETPAKQTIDPDPNTVTTDSLRKLNENLREKLNKHNILSKNIDKIHNDQGISLKEVSTPVRDLKEQVTILKVEKESFNMLHV